jgi:hypothetical protein
VLDVQTKFDNTEGESKVHRGNYNGADLDFVKVYPTIVNSQFDGRLAAKFVGPTFHGHRTSEAYRIDFVDYSNVSNYYLGKDNDANTPIPFNTLGEGLNGSFSMEVIFKRESGKSGNILAWANSFGSTLGVTTQKDDDGNTDIGRLDFYIVTSNDPNGRSEQGVDATCRSNDLKEEGGPKGPAIEAGQYYHVVGTYDIDGEKMVLYVDGVKVNETSLLPGYRVRFPLPKKEDVLAQWVCIGADPRRADPIDINGRTTTHVNSDWENWAEFAFTGEIVVARIYGKSLSATEVTTLYNYEKPE